MSDRTEADEPMSDDDLRACDDHALLARSSTGDTGAFGELVHRHQQAALRVATVIIGSTEEAKDVVQDALIKVHRRQHTYRARGSVRSWMLRIVANEAKNHARGRARRRLRDDRAARMSPTAAEGADVAAMARLSSDAMMQALHRLRETDRDVLSCRYIVGLDEQETAAVLGLRRGTVKSRTSRALERLRTAIGSAEETP